MYKQLARKEHSRPATERKVGVHYIVQMTGEFEVVVAGEIYNSLAVYLIQTGATA